MDVNGERESPLIYHAGIFAAGDLSPLPRRRVMLRGRCLRRDVDAHPSSRGSGRRLEGVPTDGSRSRRLVATVAAEAPAMEPVCGNRPRAQGVNVDVRATGRGGKPKHRSGAQNRRTRVPKGNPGTVRSQRALQQGSQGDLPESPGASPPPGCRVGTRVPVAPRGAFRGTDGACNNLCEVEPMSQQSKASRPQATGALAEVMFHQVRKADGRGNEAFTPIAAVSGARSLPGSHVPAQEGLPQGRGCYRGRRGGAGAPCRGAWEVGGGPLPPAPNSGMTGRLPG